ncbi:hypothetical protein BaRGS_00000540 [Batillaria attramentaria]|uniref:Uncharacterized protein n=1 Tax=Batillaria attramentaria TaxID=370345 RepID=A0ABD0MA31_9CAEN
MKGALERDNSCKRRGRISGGVFCEGGDGGVADQADSEADVGVQLDVLNPDAVESDCRISQTSLTDYLQQRERGSSETANRIRDFDGRKVFPELKALSPAPGQEEGGLRKELLSLSPPTNSGCGTAGASP